jgi:hypothetical protein
MPNGFDWQSSNELIDDIRSGESERLTNAENKVRELRNLICSYERTIDSYREVLRSEFSR